MLLLNTAGEHLFPCLPQILEATCIPWLPAPSSICRAHGVTASGPVLLSSRPLLLGCGPPAPFHKDPVMALGPLRQRGIISPLKILNLVTPLQSPFYHVGSHSQSHIWGIRTCTSLGGRYSAHRKYLTFLFPRTSLPI